MIKWSNTEGWRSKQKLMYLSLPQEREKWKERGKRESNAPPSCYDPHSVDPCPWSTYLLSGSKLPHCFLQRTILLFLIARSPQKLPSHLYVLSPYPLFLYNNKKTPPKYSSDMSPVRNLRVSVRLKV